MPQPVASDVYVNIPLTQIAIAFMQKADSFISDKVFPNIPVDQQSAVYATYDRSFWYRSEAQLRGPGAESAGSGWAVDFNSSYFAKVYAVHKDVDDQTRANQTGVINLDRDATRWCSTQMMLKRELVWASQFFTTGVWTGGAGAVDMTGVPGAPGANQFKQWDQAGSTPIEDIQQKQTEIGEGTGYTPNILVLSPYVFNRLRAHAEFLDRIKYTERGVVTAELMAAVLGVDKVLVGRAVQNVSKEGNATQTNSYILPKAALLCYAAPEPSILEPSAGYQFSWTGYLGAGNAGQRIKSFRMEELASDRVEGEIAVDQKVVASDLAVYFTAAVA